MNNYGEHYSVFHKECIDCFNEIENLSSGHIADLTFGAGGHSSMMIEQLNVKSVVGVDQDQDAINNANQKYSDCIDSGKLELLKMNFQEFPSHWKDNCSEKKLFGVVLDLGVSSHQFDNAERGFSYRFEGPLDMRMDNTNDEVITAEEVINTYSLEELNQIFKEYGEEKLSYRIATQIVEQRSRKKVTNTKQLEEIVFNCYPKKWRHGRTHPATRVFQALRIEVNRELRVLENVLPQLLDLLEPGGRIFVISFHSLEDRIVKHTFKNVFKENKNIFKILTKRPLLPTEQEMSENVRSRSAKLRIMERIG